MQHVGSVFAWRTSRALIGAIGEIPDVLAKGFSCFRGESENRTVVQNFVRVVTIPCFES